MSARIIAAAAVFSAFFATTTASAAVITDVELYNGGETVTFGYAPDGSDPYHVAGTGGLAGQINLTTDTGGVINAWCMDFFHDVYLGGGQALTYTGYNLVGASNGNGGTVDAPLASEIAGLVSYGNTLIAAGGATVDQSAGIQMAIWSLEYNGLTFTGPSGAVTAWQSDLALAPGLAASASVESLVSLTGTQQLAAYATQVPEPASLATFGLGLLGLVGLRRRQPSRSPRVAMAA